MADFQLADNQRQIDEGETPHLQATLQDDKGVAVPLTAMVTITLTEWWNDTPTTSKSINGWNALNALNNDRTPNGKTVFDATSGQFDWYGVAADSTIQSTDPGVMKETHYFRLDFTYNQTVGGVTLVRDGQYKDYYIVSKKPVLKS